MWVFVYILHSVPNTDDDDDDNNNFDSIVMHSCHATTTKTTTTTTKINDDSATISTSLTDKAHLFLKSNESNEWSVEFGEFWFATEQRRR